MFISGWRCALRLFFCACVALLSACGGSDSQNKVQYGGEMKVGVFYGNPGPINPITTDVGLSSNFLDFLFDPLIHIDEKGEIKPALAKQWDVSDDGRRWSFSLRPDVLFHDGTNLTANDVKYTYEEIRKRPNHSYAMAFQFVQEIRVLDPYKLEILFSRPDAMFLDNLSFIGVVPRHLLEGKASWDDFGSHPIGSGPFAFSEQSSGQIIFKANFAYHAGRPYLDRLVFQVLPDQRTCLSHLISGQLDFIFLLHPEDFGALGQIFDIRVYENWEPFLYFLILNTENPLFRDTRVRAALNLVVNRAEIVRKVLKGHGEEAYATVPSFSSEMPPDLTPYPYDPTKAVSLLREAGWEDHNGDFTLDREGRPFEFTALGWQGEDLSLEALRIMQQQFRQVGIQMKIQVLSIEDFIRRTWKTRDYQASVVNLSYGFHHVNDYLSWHSRYIEDKRNLAAYRNPKVDQLLDEARNTAVMSQRLQFLVNLQRELHQDPPGVFLFWRKMPVVAHVRFQGIPEKQMESFRDFSKIWIKSGSESSSKQ